MSSTTYPRVAKLKSRDDFLRRLESLGVSLPLADDLLPGAASPLAERAEVDGLSIGNRFTILPMEGWDGTTEGQPTDLTRRRWINFGKSGAKLIWGGEAVAVTPDGRANPNQLMINEANLRSIESLRTDLVTAHASEFGDSSDLCVGIQLTHSGRYAKPSDNRVAEPRAVQPNPALDPRVGSDDSNRISDDDLARLIDHFILAAVAAEKVGFDFVDVKHCHGYLGHELLGGFHRDGKFGGSFENRTRFLREIVMGIRAATKTIKIGVRVSIFDFVPYCPGEDRLGVPDPAADPKLAFGGDGTGAGIDLTESHAFVSLLMDLGIRLVCTTAGSPYYNPHIQRPAFFPPSDGYQPPEDPLVGVARQINATAEIKRLAPEAFIVGSGYSYLQDWLGHVGQAVVANRMADSVGLGRMVLSYPELPADVLAGRPSARKKICRTFSDCTTAPRNGIVSGCYPLDPFYKTRPEHDRLKEAKKGAGG